MASDPDLARDVDARCRLSGEFTLRSGQVSHEYFDKYLFETDPALLARVAAPMEGLLPEDVDLVGGLEMGGIPIATIVSAQSRLPALFVRKQAKTYGTARLAEGADVAGRRVLVVEDVATTAGQMLLSTADLRERGALVGTAVVVIDRETGGREAMAGVDVELRALFTRTDLGS